jgi:membrane-associated PAP2 superfamily phosphatase
VPAKFLYDWGEVPAVLLGMASCLMLAWAARRQPSVTLKRAGLMILLALILGPLLLTNGVFKGYYGRPRPVQVEEFRGNRPFQPVLLPSFNTKENSFPSGHAAAGFALMLPFFVLRKRHPYWAATALAGGLAWGGVMGSVRIVQGGHFFSDVIWAAGVVYFSGLAVDAWLESRAVHVSRRESRWSGRKVLLVRGAALAMCVLIGLIYLVRLPFNQTFEWIVPLAPGVERANIEIVTRDGTSARVVEAPEATELRVKLTAQGRGLPLDPVQEDATVLRSRKDVPRVRYTFLPTWSTIHFNSRIVVQAPPGVKVSIRQPNGQPIPASQAPQEPGPDEAY